MADDPKAAAPKADKVEVKQTDTGNLSILDKVKNAVAGKLDSVDKAVNPFRKVKDQLNSGVNG